MFAFVVTEPFADYAKGDVIRAEEAMEAALKDNPGRIVRVAVTDAAPAAVQDEVVEIPVITPPPAA